MYLMTQNLNLEELRAFLVWLDEKLDEKGWSDNQLAKRAGISHPVISKARSEIQPIGYEAGVKIAKALDIPPEILLQKAGLLPAITQAESEDEKELIFIFQQLPPDRQKEFIKMIRVLLPEDKRGD